MEHIRCVVERITYTNTENGYTVLKVAAKNYNDLVTVVGIMPDTHVGSVLSLEGFWKVDAKYGRQFSVERFEETLPATIYGIEKYLGSGLIKGVGPKFAKRIVQKFGKDTLDVIEEKPDELISVEGIGKIRVERIKKSWQEQKEIKNIMLFLQSHEVNTTHATRIFKTYGSDSISVVQENPYRLADDVWGIGFKTADMIAEKLGIEKGRFIRLRSGLFYTLNKLAEDGHCYGDREQLIKKAVELLEVETPELEITLDEMLRTQEVIKDEEAIYLPPFFFSETGCAKRLIKLLISERRVRMDVQAVMLQMRRQSDISYDEIQLEAIRTAVSSKVMVLTGGPGTGKTTTTMGIISAYRKAGCRIILAAPTGRAAKRMSEATGMEAKTIHRLLEYKPLEGYQKNEENPLEGDVLILDECSMIDVMLMYNLLKAVPEHMTLIMVGDTDQLPSVGAGNVLKDMIASERIPVVRLTRIFRQAQGSKIIMNAHRINKGEPIDMRGGKESDFFFAGKESNEEVVDTLVQYCTKNLPRYYHVDAFQDIQVLTPMQKGVCGAANLKYEIAKSQGSEYPIVVMPFTMSHFVMLQRNLLYTGVTRAKKILVLIGEKKAVSYAIKNETTAARNTKLAKRLMDDSIESKTVEANILKQRLSDENAEQQEKKPKTIIYKNDVQPMRVAEEPVGYGKDIFERLARSEFRSSFSLKANDRAYIADKGMDTISRHAHDFIEKRLAPAKPQNDGKQTPMRGHPVFVAQHATATCCRGCLEKWHNIPRGRELTIQEQDYVVDIILQWIDRQRAQ